MSNSNTKKYFHRTHLVLVIIICITLIIAAFLSRPYERAGSVIARQRYSSCTTGTSTSSTLSCTVTAPDNGNALIATITVKTGNTDPVSSISQSGATWSKATSSTNNSGVTTEIWYAVNVSSAGTGITVNLASTYYSAAIVGEYSGILNNDPLDKTATSTGSSTSASTGTTTTTSQSNQMWIGGLSAYGTPNPGTFSNHTNSFSELTTALTGSDSDGRSRLSMAEYTASATGAASTSATISSSNVWSGAIATFNARVVPTKFAFTNSSQTLSAGSCSGAITVEAQDASNVPATPASNVVMSVTSNSNTLSLYNTSDCSGSTISSSFAFNGLSSSFTFYFKDTKKSSGYWTLTASQLSGSDTISDGTQNYIINAASMSRLVIAMPGQTFTDGTGLSGSPSNRTAGTSFNITSIAATDNFNNVVTGYGGSKTLSFSGPQNAPSGTTPSYTTSVSFTNGVATTTLATTLYKAQSTTLTATDGGQYGYASTSFTVDPGSLYSYSIDVNTTATAGTCSTIGNSISALDQWQNARTNDNSVVNMTSSGTGVTFYTTSGCTVTTSQYTLSSGSANFYFKSTKKQSMTITATKNGDVIASTSSTITVNPGTVSTLLIVLPGQSFSDGTGVTGSSSFSGLRSPNATAGTAFSISIKAVDANNNLVDSGPSNYTGAKTLSYSSSTAGNAPNSQIPSFPSTSITFTNGSSSSLSTTYYLASSGRTFQANDTQTPITGTASSSFEVKGGALNNFLVVPASTSQTAGVAFNVTITARDSYENTITSPPVGNYGFTTNANKASDNTSPILGNLINSDFTNGVATKSVTLYKAESSVSFSVSEPGGGPVSSTSSNLVTVSAGNISGDITDSPISVSSNTVAASNSVTVTITLRDTWLNPKSNVSSANITIVSSGGETITQPSSNTNASGQTTGSISWGSNGTKLVKVQISNVSLVQNDGTTADSDGYLDRTQNVNVGLSPGDTVISGGSKVQGGSTIR